MKKIAIFIGAIILVIAFSGCYKHYEDVSLVDVKFYDTNDDEIIGEYINYFHRNFLVKQNKLNSAAPVVNYYCAEVAEGSTVKVVMKFKTKTNLDIKMDSLTLICQDNIELLESNMDSIEVIDGFTYVTYTAKDINADTNLFKIYTWSEAGSKEHFSTRGSNTYIRGFYFPFKNNDEEI